jgi:hypothetical protein
MHWHANAIWVRRSTDLAALMVVSTPFDVWHFDLPFEPFVSDFP